MAESHSSLESDLQTPCELSTQGDIPCELSTHMDISSELNASINVPHELSTQADTLYDLNAPINIPDELNTQLNSLCELTTEINTASEIDAQINTASELDVPFNTASGLDAQINTPCKLEIQISTPSELNTQINTSFLLDTQINPLCELDTQINTTNELATQFNPLCELDTHINTTSELDTHNTTSELHTQINTTRELDTQINATSELDNQINTVSELDTTQSNPTSELDAQINTPCELDTQINKLDTPCELDTQINNLHELNTQINTPSELDIQVNTSCELSTQINTPCEQNTQVDILCEPSTSLSADNSFLSQSSLSGTASDVNPIANNGAEFGEVEPALTPMEFENSAGEYFFDTDHPALRENSDYRKLLHTVIIMESKRAKAIKDLEKLRECRERALADPIGFIDKLQRGEDLGIPKPQKIPEIPEIDWTKYTVTPSEASFEKRQLTRQSTKIMCDILSPARGKTLSEQKAYKSNQSWSTEEQKKLEELLVQYPPEEVETRRWEKIANELENRTPIQVASRVQKYFIKLMRAGMPIPGRQPNSCYNRKPRRQVVRQQPSTFFASCFPAMYLNEDDESMSCNNSEPTSRAQSASDTSDDSDAEITQDLKHTAEYRELLSMKRALKEKKRSSGLAQHVGFKCGRCECTPIIGTRWHCLECKASVDFCDDCVDCMHEFDTHTADHKLEAIKHAIATSLDRDYMLFPGVNLNYLDPNYGH